MGRFNVCERDGVNGGSGPHICSLSQSFVDECEHLFLKGNDSSLKITCLEMCIFPLLGSRHIYPLCLVLYPRKTHGIDLGSSLWTLVARKQG